MSLAFGSDEIAASSAVMMAPGQFPIMPLDANIAPLCAVAPGQFPIMSHDAIGAPPYAVYMVPFFVMPYDANDVCAVDQAQVPACLPASTRNSGVRACATARNTARLKLQSKRLTAAKIAPLGASVSTSGVAARANACLEGSQACLEGEKHLRLSLAALPEDGLVKCCVGSTSPTTAPSSTLSVVSDSTSICPTTSRTETEQAIVPYVREVYEPRIGVDIGGVITQLCDESDNLIEVPGAVDSIRIIAQLFGPMNVFLVSRLRLGGGMEHKVKRWLQEEVHFFNATGVPVGNLLFVSDVSGPGGKGVAAAYSGLSHFIDDRFDVLQAVFSDLAGNSGGLVRHFRGTLFHFAKGGEGRWRPRIPSNMLENDLRSHYAPVACWAEVLDHLRHEADPTNFRAQVVATALMCRISVGIDEDSSFKVAQRVAGARNANLKYIATYAGTAQAYLCGRGSSFMPWETLAVCISANTLEDLDAAITLVEDLLEEIHGEYREFLAMERKSIVLAKCQPSQGHAKSSKRWADM